MNQLEHYRRRIDETARGVSIETIRLNSEGLMSDVCIVNEELVFRFPKREHALSRLKDEARILRLLRRYISLEIPAPLFEGEDFLVYRMIPGETLRRDMLLKLPVDDQKAIADQLAQFFKELHNVPVEEITDFEIPLADALMKREGWMKVYERIRAKVFPLLLPHVRDWAEEHFESHLADHKNFDYEMRLVDTDIPPYHILFDKGARRLSGIIDFGCAGLGDPAIDLGVVMYNYGEPFLERFYGVYPEAETYLKRARFYAGSQEMRWILTGIERGDPMWFAVHTSGAKDFGP